MEQLKVSTKSNPNSSRRHGGRLGRGRRGPGRRRGAQPGHQGRRHRRGYVAAAASTWCVRPSPTSRSTVSADDPLVIEDAPADRRARHPDGARGVRRPDSTARVARSASASLSAVSEPRRYFVRTFGCQMNEHDSERIAGLLEADGLEATDQRRGRRRRRAQHVLHPGERRQQALRHPRPPQVAEGPQAPACRSWSPAAWPRRTATPSASGRRTSTWCSAPTTCTGPPSCSTRPRPTGHRSSRSSRRPSPTTSTPSRRRCPVRREVPWAGWVTIQIGCDNSCAFCIVPAVRGKEISRPFDDIVAEVGAPAADGVTEVTLLGQNVNSYGRDLTLAARQAGGDRPRPPAVRRAAPGGRRRRGHPAGPLHEPAPEGPAARDDRGHGRDAGGVRAPPPAAAVGQRPGAGRHAPRLHRRALPRAAGRRPRRHRRPGRHHRHHRGLPRRDRRRLRAHPRGRGRGRLRQRLHLHLQPPPGHRGRRAGRRASSPAEVVAERFERLRVVVERSGAGQARGPGRAGRGGARRGPVPQGPRRPHRPHPPEQARALRRRAPIRPGSYATRARSRARRRTTCAASWSRSPGPAAHKTRLPLLVG